MLVRAILALAAVAAAADLPREDGYRGIWYFNQPSNDQYGYKYSGGFATYPQQQSPIAIYVASQNKTFFCYGGTAAGRRELLHMVSYFDHKTGKVPRPAVLMNKQTGDAHDNPVMAIDEAGYLWIFSNAHGTARPSFIHRSVQPYSIDAFELVHTGNFSYGHPWYHPGRGFLFLHTLYEDKGRSLYWTTSRDGRAWNPPALLARVDLGHYQITAHSNGRSGTAFNYHPAPGGLNQRTNLYYLETNDMGKTWKAVDGRTVSLPLRVPANPALVHDYRSDGLLVYLKNVVYDRRDQPVILYLTSKGFESGPANGPRQWHTARWTGSKWLIRPFTPSDHNYDYGALWIDNDGTWRIVAPTEPGPQPFTTGGDMVLWTSVDEGKSWRKVRQLTHALQRNHTYARVPVNAHPGFHALWADGDTLKPSDSFLYFTNRTGSAVWRLPVKMSGQFASPEKVE